MNKDKRRMLTVEEYITAEELFDMLEEKNNRGGKEQIRRACMVLGREKALETGKTAVTMKEKIFVRNMSRPRTIGGNFFVLLNFLAEKRVITKDELLFIRLRRPNNIPPQFAP